MGSRRRQNLIHDATATFEYQAKFLTLPQLAKVAAGNLEYIFDIHSISILSFKGDDWAHRGLSLSRSFAREGVSVSCRFSFKMLCSDRSKLIQIVRDFNHPWPTDEHFANTDSNTIHFQSCFATFAKDEEPVTLEPAVRNLILRYILLSKILIEHQWNKQKSIDESSSLLGASTAASLF